MIKPFVRFSVVFLMAAAIGACGSKVPRPVSELALANSALKSAETSGAREYAPIEMRLAREKKEAAEAAIADKQYEKARQLTLEARVDAELARAAAEAERSRMGLHEAQDNIRLIRLEAIRTSAGQQ